MILSDWTRKFQAVKEMKLLTWSMNDKKRSPFERGDMVPKVHGSRVKRIATLKDASSDQPGAAVNQEDDTDKDEAMVSEVILFRIIGPDTMTYIF